MINEVAILNKNAPAVNTGFDSLPMAVPSLEQRTEEKMPGAVGMGKFHAGKVAGV